MVIYLDWGANDLHMVQQMPLPLIISCFIKILLILGWLSHHISDLLPLVVIIAMVFRIVNSTDIHNNVTLGQFARVTCPTHSSKKVSKKVVFFRLGYMDHVSHFCDSLQPYTSSYTLREDHEFMAYATCRVPVALQQAFSLVVNVLLTNGYPGKYDLVTGYIPSLIAYPPLVQLSSPSQTESKLFSMRPTP